MDPFLQICIIVLIIILLYKNTEPYFTESTICSNHDGQCYKISTSFDKATYDGAVNKLASLNKFNADFITYLRNKYIWVETPIDSPMVAITKQLISNYNPNALKENNPSSSKKTSYVLEKGESVAFCLREKDSGDNNFEDQDMLLFVNIHEISHLAMSYHDPSHSPEFWKTFKLLLNEAQSSGLYKLTNWADSPKNYCGLRVDYNPAYDESIV